jgi:microcystin-dependent protein
MGTPFVAELRWLSFNFAPKGWALCNGQLLPINQNQALFSLLGTTYGGDGQVNFALPEMRGRVPIHTGGAVGAVLGQRGGEENHTVIMSELPAHNHSVNATNSPGTTNTPSATYLANSNQTPYRSSSNSSFNGLEVSSAGGSQAHYNMSPYLVLNCAIALQGVFPSRN